ncbi:MAG: hydrogenase maturation nickel metallochaperone HypA [Planctomycetaceae bacterium]|nr:hydrogenase maturation nickel metallochaperone HypA [Planctomycetaceae bacterium]
MHETAVAESILQTICDYAAKMNARPVRAVVSCGQFNALNDEVMRFAFEAAAESTVAQGMDLQIRHIPLRAACKACRISFEFDIYDPVCPSCKSMEFEFEPDAPLLLEDIEFEDPNEGIAESKDPEPQ